MISFTVSGSTARTDGFLDKMIRGDLYSGLDAYAKRGVLALQSHTPVETGLTAASWSYEIDISKDKATITWLNSNTVSGVNIAVILQYGHGTGTGGYVAGRDYINPALQPIFDEIAEAVWRRVTSA